jgi:SAM-dependent methyltransferase
VAGTMIDRLHRGYVFSRRVRVLTQHLLPMIPTDAQVLDIGCGDGLLGRQLNAARPDICIRGIDVLIRPNTHIPVARFDGLTIPFSTASFDIALLVDVLHHTEHPLTLLREAARVARHGIVIKDHTRNGLLAGPTLRLMDYVGNAHHGVALPYTYWSRTQWDVAFAKLRLRPTMYLRSLGLYPRPARWILDRSLHFIAKLEHSIGRD